ncbi:hypothetical protein BV22DRAFT_1047715 [Leucogyrophana mollusca]|uniref:Uncharacterized protein n=1 Tax=Leucogyrophana mollusca TaxID=85980 RepID=A0ACB8BFI2_9AGAM|nr:hypothetical protein BV22DRAFT_1047715 [Leucogyrophana mollusca]
MIQSSPFASTTHHFARFSNHRRLKEYFVDTGTYHGLTTELYLELTHLRRGICGTGDPSKLSREVKDLPAHCEWCLLGQRFCAGREQWLLGVFGDVVMMLRDAVLWQKVYSIATCTSEDSLEVPGDAARLVLMFFEPISPPTLPRCLPIHSVVDETPSSFST